MYIDFLCALAPTLVARYDNKYNNKYNSKEQTSNCVLVLMLAVAGFSQCSANLAFPK